MQLTKHHHAILMIILMVILTLGLAVSLYLSQKPQDIRQQAASPQGTAQISLSPTHPFLEPNTTKSVNLIYSNTGQADGIQVIVDIFGEIPNDITLTPLTPPRATLVTSSLIPIEAGHQRLTLVFVSTDPIQPIPPTTFTTSIGKLDFTAPQSGIMTLSFNQALSRIALHNTGTDILSVPDNRHFYFRNIPTEPVTINTDNFSLSTSGAYLEVNGQILTFQPDPGTTPETIFFYDGKGNLIHRWIENSISHQLVFQISLSSTSWKLGSLHYHSGALGSFEFNSNYVDFIPFGQSLNEANIYSSTVDNQGHLSTVSLPFLTVTQTPDVTPTPSPSPGTTISVANLDLDIKIQGLNSDIGPVVAAVKLGMGLSDQPLVTLDTPFVYNPDSQTYTATLDLTHLELDPTGPYWLAIKGEKHLARVFRQLDFSSPFIDLTSKPLEPGDMPGDEGQDGRIDQNDINQVISILAKPGNPTLEELRRGDVNYDGVVNAFDIGQIFATLSSKPDESLQ